MHLRSMDRSEADLKLFEECFDRNGSPRIAGGLRWQYFDNPVGRLYVDLALTEEKDRIGAIYASLPSHFQRRGSSVVALQSLDTLTDVQFRGRGLFVGLARRVFERAESDGVSLIYGFPNESSGPGFYGKLGWTNLGPVPFLMRPLRLRYLAGRARVPFAEWVPDLPLVTPLRLAPSIDIRPVHEFGPVVDALWDEFSANIPLAVRRDARYLTWRLSKPPRPYTVLGAYRDGELQALTAFYVTEKHGGHTGYVMDLLHRPRAKWDATQLLRYAIERLADAGADFVLAWCLPHSPNFASHLAAGFLPLPERLRPIKLSFGARAFGTTSNSEVGTRRNWYLSYLDSDTV